MKISKKHGHCIEIWVERVHFHIGTVAVVHLVYSRLLTSTSLFLLIVINSYVDGLLHIQIQGCTVFLQNEYCNYV